MKKAKIKAIVDVINHFAKIGVLNSDEHVALRKAVDQLLHAVSIKDIKLVEKAISKVSELLLKI